MKVVLILSGHYAIVKKEWQSDEMIIWLRLIDLLACGEKWDRCSIMQQDSRHLCVHSSSLKDGVAIRGLPENCYNPHWLDCLKPCERELYVQLPFSMKFTDEEQWCVICDLGI